MGLKGGKKWSNSGMGARGETEKGGGLGKDIRFMSFLISGINFLLLFKQHTWLPVYTSGTFQIKKKKKVHNIYV